MFLYSGQYQFNIFQTAYENKSIYINGTKFFIKILFYYSYIETVDMIVLKLHNFQILIICLEIILESLTFRDRLILQVMWRVHMWPTETPIEPVYLGLTDILDQVLGFLMQVSCKLDFG